MERSKLVCDSRELIESMKKAYAQFMAVDSCEPLKWEARGIASAVSSVCCFSDVHSRLFWITTEDVEDFFRETPKKLQEETSLTDWLLKRAEAKRLTAFKEARKCAR